MRPSELLIDLGRPVAFYPVLTQMTGSTNATLFLCQLIFWTGKQKDPEGWIFKQSEDLEEETGLSYEEQKNARARLVKLGLIEEKYKRLEHEMYFRVVTGKLDELFPNMAKSNSGNGQSPIGEQGNDQLANKGLTRSLIGTPETTPETTSSAKWLSLLQSGTRYASLQGLEKYPEDTQEVLKVFCELWNFVPPKGKQKAYWIQSARDLKEACGTMGVEALRGYRQEFEGHMATHQGLPPFSVNSPNSLVNAIRGFVAANYRPDQERHSVLNWD